MPFPSHFSPFRTGIHSACPFILCFPHFDTFPGMGEWWEIRSCGKQPYCVVFVTKPAILRSSCFEFQNCHCLLPWILLHIFFRTVRRRTLLDFVGRMIYDLNQAYDGPLAGIWKGFPRSDCFLFPVVGFLIVSGGTWRLLFVRFNPKSAFCKQADEFFPKEIPMKCIQRVRTGPEK